MKEHHTTPEDLPDDRGEAGGWRNALKKLARPISAKPNLVTFSLALVGLVAIVYALVANDPFWISFFQYLFIIIGALQILAGVYLSGPSAAFLRDLIEQEKTRPTKFVREVELTRAQIDLLVRLKDVEVNPVSGAPDWPKALNAIILEYETIEEQQSSVGLTYKRLSQADIAQALLTASANTLCGTVLIVLGTIVPLIVKP